MSVKNQSNSILEGILYIVSIVGFPLLIVYIVSIVGFPLLIGSVVSLIQNIIGIKNIERVFSTIPSKSTGASLYLQYERIQREWML